ncbi:hypothetical protein DQP57_14540 [Mycobacterium colombiense]|uniref:Uncharacterized protein n=1 Tax=Mycobacterium colombiense TaxID=339268 RepID=A0A329LT27_9MYCO|nr:hypothetical protein DQP57_14540 [Mycobacterium colombiense]
MQREPMGWADGALFHHLPVGPAHGCTDVRFVTRYVEPQRGSLRRRELLLGAVADWVLLEHMMA